MDFSGRGTASPSVLTARHFGWLAIGTLVLAVYGSLIPFTYRPRSLDDAMAAFRHIAFFDPTYLEGRGDWLISVVLFLALSFLFMAAICVDRRARIQLIAAPAVVLFCALLSVAIEFTQLYFPPRTVSLNDIIVETLGGIAGTLLWIIGGQRLTKWVRRVATGTDLASLASRLFPGYVVLLLIVLLMPFDLTISPGEFSVKYQEGKIWIFPFHRFVAEGEIALLVKLAANVACFFPLGFFKALASEHGPTARRRWPWLLLFGLGITSLVEFLQLLVYSRVCDTTDILTGTVAVLLGGRAGEALLAARRSAIAGSVAGPPTDDRIRWGRVALLTLLLLAWFGGILYLSWSPFDFTIDAVAVWLRRIAWLPLVDYYWGSKYHALDLFLKKSVSFLPLGILGSLALPSDYRPWATPSVLLAAILASVAIEVGRSLLPSHSGSVTDVMLHCGGAWLGYKLTQYVRPLLCAENTRFSR